ncbi:MAG: metal-dependent hydrolase [Candidatus Aenigmarchaeota archaeon]|nr:metal-dependent hydrolase [Candidatus Aenigmarchaeota archaeon]
MRIKYFGHSAFLIEDLLIDPFIEHNPHCKIKAKDIKCNIICITHDHGDHLGDGFEIAKNNNAVIVAIYELSQLAQKNGLKSEGMNIGGWITAGDWRIKMTEALHSSQGHSAGFILHNTKVNKKIYHAGDTGLFGDMKLIGNEGIDIAMLPIGDRYTMGIADALKAVEFIRPKMVIPIHYNTFPIITADPEDFRKNCPVNTVIFQANEEKDL